MASIALLDVRNAKLLPQQLRLANDKVSAHASTSNQTEVAKVIEWVCGVLLLEPKKGQESEKPPRQDERYWNVLNSALDLPAFRSVNLSKKLVAAVCQAVGELIGAVDTCQETSFQLVLHNVLHKVTSELGLVPKWNDASKLLVSLMDSPYITFDKESSVSLACSIFGSYLDAAEALAPRKMFEAFVKDHLDPVLVFRYKLLESMKGQMDDDNSSVSTSRVLWGLVNRTLSSALFHTEFIESYVGVCDRAAQLLGFAAAPTATKKRARKSGNSDSVAVSKSKEQHSFLRNLFSKLAQVLNDRTASPEQHQATGHALTFLSVEFSRVLKQVLLSTHSNGQNLHSESYHESDKTHQTNQAPKRQREKDNSIRSMRAELVFWLELLQIETDCAKNVRDSDYVVFDELSSLILAAREYSLYKVSDRKVDSVCTWFQHLLGSWQQRAKDHSETWIANASSRKLQHRILNGHNKVICDLLDLDHAIVEPTMVATMQYATHFECILLGVKDGDIHLESSEERSCTKLFVAYCASFSKMRRLSVVLEAIGSACKTHATEIRCLLFSRNQDKFSRALAQFFLQVPSGQFSQVWDCLHNNVFMVASNNDTQIRGSHLYILSCMFVKFIDSIRITQYNAKQIASWTCNTVNMNLRPLLRTICSDEMEGEQPVLFAAAAVRLLLSLVEVYRLSKAWSYDARPTTVAAIFGTEQPTLEGSNTATTLEYTDDLLSSFALPEDSKVVSISDLVKVVQKLSPNCFKETDLISQNELDETIRSLMMARIHHLFEDFYRFSVYSGKKDKRYEGAFKEAQSLIDKLFSTSLNSGSIRDAKLASLGTRNLIVLGRMASQSQVDQLLEQLVSEVIQEETPQQQIAPSDHPFTHPLFYEVDAFQQRLPVVSCETLRDLFHHCFKVGECLENTHTKSTRKPSKKDSKKRKNRRPSEVAEVGHTTLLTSMLNHTLASGSERDSQDISEMLRLISVSVASESGVNGFVDAVEFQSNNLSNSSWLLTASRMLRLLAALPCGYLPSSYTQELLILGIVFLCGAGCTMKKTQEYQTETMNLLISSLHFISSLISQHGRNCCSDWPIEALLRLVAACVEEYLDASCFGAFGLCVELIMPYCRPEDGGEQKAVMSRCETVIQFLTKKCNTKSKKNSAWWYITALVVQELVHPTNSRDQHKRKVSAGHDNISETELKEQEQLAKLDVTKMNIAQSVVEWVDSNLHISDIEEPCDGDPKFLIYSAIMVYHFRTLKESEMQTVPNGLVERVIQFSSTLLKTCFDSCQKNLSITEYTSSVSFITAYCFGLRHQQTVVDDSQYIESFYSSVVQMVSTLRDDGDPEKERLANECVSCFFRECSNTQLVIVLDLLQKSLGSSLREAKCVIWMVCIALPVLSVRRQALSKVIGTFCLNILGRAASLCITVRKHNPSCEQVSGAQEFRGEPLNLVAQVLTAISSWRRKGNSTSNASSNPPTRTEMDTVECAISTIAEVLHGLEYSSQGVDCHAQSVKDSCTVLYLLLKHYSSALYAQAPAFCGTLVLLESSVLRWCSPTRGELSLPMTCMEDVSRVYEELTNHKQVFRHHAAALISALLATYDQPGVHHLAERESQRISNFLFELCSKYELQQLHASLPTSSKAMLKTLHTTFEQQHKFTGKT